MADTLPNTLLPTSVWVDLYAATGLEVGTHIIVQNIGVADVYLFAGAAEPAEDELHQIIKRGQYAINDVGDAGAWALCLYEDGRINVRVP